MPLGLLKRKKEANGLIIKPAESDKSMPESASCQRLLPQPSPESTILDGVVTTAISMI